MAIPILCNRNNTEMGQFEFNERYILFNTLPQKQIDDAEIALQSEDEIFVRHPDWHDYYVSQFGRAISVKDNRCNLLAMTLGGQPGYQYFYYKFCEPGKKETSISAQRAVADIWCPNFWQDKTGNKLQAHHLDRNKLNNNYKNIMLLPTKLHTIMNRVDCIYLNVKGESIEMTPYEIMLYTGLTLTAIILGIKNSIPLEVSEDISYFDMEGFIIAVKFSSQKRKRKDDYGKC